MSNLFHSRLKLFYLMYLYTFLSNTNAFVGPIKFSRATAIVKLAIPELSVMAELLGTAAPVLFILYKSDVDNKLKELTKKLETLDTGRESSLVAAESFNEDMKGAINAYQDLYGALSTKIDSVLESNNKKKNFENELLQSLSGIQVLGTEIETLRSNYTKLADLLDTKVVSNNRIQATEEIASLKNLIGELQQGLEKRIAAAETLNARERARMARELQIQQEQLLQSNSVTVSDLNAKVDSIQSAINQKVSTDTVSDSELGERTEAMMLELQSRFSALDTKQKDLLVEFSVLKRFYTNI